jgi:cytochrome c oxidase subunit 1
MTVAGAASRPPLIRRLVGFHLVTAVVLAAIGYLLGHWLGGRIGGPSLAYVADTGESDVGVALGYLLGVVGFLVGLGFANYPLARMLGRPPMLPRPATEGVGRYFGLCPDHKVVAKQYFVGVGLFFAIAGLNAMLIRLELLQPGQNIWPPDRYLEIVGLHGSMMMGVMTSGSWDRWATSSSRC